MEPFVKFSGGRWPDKVRIIGGGANSDLWCQIHADVLKTEIHRVKDPIYANLKGAGLMALFGSGTISRSEIKAAVEIDQIFIPHLPNEELLDDYYEVFSKIYKRHKPLFRLLTPLRTRR
jgi:xylulokinase